MAPPQVQEIADTYYVVDRGREVGIFVNKYVELTPNLNRPHSLPAYCPPAQSAVCLMDTKSR